MFFIYCFAALVFGFVICVIAGKRSPWLVQVAYSAAVVGSIITAGKVVHVYDGVYTSVAVGLYAMTFLFTDYLGEIYGRKHALRAVVMGFVSALVVLFAIQMSIVVEPAPFWESAQKSYEEVHGRTARLVFASIIAFVAAQVVDVYVFDWIKEKTKGKFLALRNNGSTFMGQGVDSVIFFSVGFYGLVPNILDLIFVSFIVKIVVALLDTPVIYLARHVVLTRDSEPVPEHL